MGAAFCAFVGSGQTGGFARDLFIDYVRLQYYKGHVIPLSPELGLWPWENKESVRDEIWFPEILEWNEESIRKQHGWTQQLLEQLKKNQERRFDKRRSVVKQVVDCLAERIQCNSQAHASNSRSTVVESFTTKERIKHKEGFNCGLFFCDLCTTNLKHR